MRIALTIAYDGTSFAGFQIQPNQRTVQGILQETLTELTKQPTFIHGSGRTDAGVHARGQVCHFDTLSPIPPERYVRILQRRLPADLTVMQSKVVSPDFHARFSAHWKWYRYQVSNELVLPPDVARFTTSLTRKIDVTRVHDACKQLIGKHDFTSFCTKCDIKNKERTIFSCKLSSHKDGWHIDIVGSGFLYNMVRIIVGTLYEIGHDYHKIAPILDILKAKDRQQAGITLPPQGLWLMQVGYDPYVLQDEHN